MRAILLRLHIQGTYGKFTFNLNTCSIKGLQFPNESLLNLTILKRLDSQEEIKGEVYVVEFQRRKGNTFDFHKTKNYSVQSLVKNGFLFNKEGQKEEAVKLQKTLSNPAPK